MANQSNGFYSYIEEKGHHDAWRIIVLVFVLVIIGLLTWFFSSSDGKNSKSTDINGDIPLAESLTDAERLELLNKPSSIPPTNPTMTDAERYKLMMGNPPKAPMLQ